MDRPRLEVADVFRCYGSDYRLQHGASMSMGSFQQRYVKRHAIYHKPDIHNEICLFAAPKIRPTSRIKFLGA
jgi:hypothetical protein